MHELSIVLSIVDTAEEVVRRENGECVQEIDLMIGDLAGVDSHALDFAWDSATRNTVLEHAILNIEQIKGLAYCPKCNVEFEIRNVYDGCPYCNEFLIHIRQGKELKIKSLSIH